MKTTLPVLGTWEWIIIGFIFIGFLCVVRVIYWGWRDGRKPTPNDLLFDLKWKIEYCILDEHSELYLFRQIKELRLRSDINKEHLSVLEAEFRRRFSVLHENDKF